MSGLRLRLIRLTSCKEDDRNLRTYEGIRERKGEEAKRYLEQANRSLAKLQKRLDEKAHECA